MVVWNMSKLSESSAPSSEAAARKPPQEVEVRTLLGAGREVVLLHNGERYRLRVTARDKLILTK
jgi:hemin uptake protein HemP